MVQTFCFSRFDNEYHRVPVIASYRIAGYTFLIHRAVDEPTMYSATFAPVGLHAGRYSTIESAIDYLASRADAIPQIIRERLGAMNLDNAPFFGPETGIQVELSWRDREKARFDNREYLPVVDSAGHPICFPPEEHYLHLSTAKTESDYVAYTPNEEYGKRDRQVRLKFGKYLRKTFPHMSDSDIQQAVNTLRAKINADETPCTLHFTTDRAVIDEIFETQMYAHGSCSVSCMYGKFEGYYRPYHVYANSPDVAVAYLVDKGRIVARSVVSTKDKRWVRAYSVQSGESPLCERLTEELERLGYTQGDLKGNRLSIVGGDTDGDNLPYLDGCAQDVQAIRGYWLVTTDGEYTCTNTDGTGERKRPACPECGRDEDDCQCVYCGCCEERFRRGCEECSMCEECECCITHDSCICERCTRCNQLINPRSRYSSRCDCDRCEECGELVRECECEKCEECGELINNCECEEEEEDNETTNDSTDQQDQQTQQTAELEMERESVAA
mgnify:CR=1 FL=1